MTLSDLLTLTTYLAGFFLGVGMVIYGLTRDDENGWSGPNDDPEPEPLPGPAGRELVGAGR